MYLGPKAADVFLDRLEMLCHSVPTLIRKTYFPPSRALGASPTAPGCCSLGHRCIDLGEGPPLSSCQSLIGGDRSEK